MKIFIHSILSKIGLPKDRTDSLIKNDIFPGYENNPILAHAAKNQLSNEFLLGLLSDWIMQPDVYSDCISFVKDYVELNYAQHTDFEQGMYWHLSGYLLSREKSATYQTLRNLNKSIDHLENSNHPLFEYYISRVYNTMGQISYSNGLLDEAILEYEMALKYKLCTDDAYGMALTYGNLGRLNFENGNFELAREYLEKDLQILYQSFPDLTRVRGQILSNLGICLLELSELKKARNCFEECINIAIENNNPISQIFALIGLSKTDLLSGNLLSAEDTAEQVFSKIKSLQESSEKYTLIYYSNELKGKIFWKKSKLSKACQHFELARQSIPNSRISKIQISKFLTEYSNLMDQMGKISESRDLILEALISLDRTSVEIDRKTLESILKEKDRNQWLLHTFSRFIGIPNFEKLLDESGLEGFSGKNQEITVMFCDIRGFTGISEKLKPEVVIEFLNEFLERILRIIQSYGAYVDKIIGDSILSLFTLPEPRPDDCDRAAVCALHIMEEIKKLNRLANPAYPEIIAGIGMQFGKVVTGLVGSAAKRSYTAIGDVVNMASRFEGMTNKLGPPIIVGGDFVNSLEDPSSFYFLPIGKFVPFGRNRGLELYSLEGFTEGSADLEELDETIRLSQSSLDGYYKKEFRTAANGFYRLSVETGYEAFRMLYNACDQYISDPPGNVWDGSVRIDNK